MTARLGRVAIIALAVTALSGGAAYADTIALSSLPLGSQNTNVLVFSNATLTGYGSSLYIGAAGVDHEVCALYSGCEADINIDFAQPISNLTLQTFGWDSGDFVDFLVYGASNVFLGSVVNVNSNTVVTGLSGYTGVTRLYIDDHSTGAGFGYDNFQFTTSTTSVPDPGSSLLLLGMGLAGLRAWRKRK
jgi:hypothetical protein